MKYTQTNTKKKKMIWIIAGIVIILVALFFLQNKTTTGEISITPPNGTAAVYIDRDSVSPITSTTSPSTYEVSPGSRQLLIARDGYWPWSQQIDVSVGETTQIQPFLIEKTGRHVLQTTSTITNALQNAQSETVLNADEPLLSPNGDIRVFVDSETNIIAQWTGSTSTAPDFFDCYEGTCGVSVFNQAPIKQIAFYPDRNDVIFFAAEKGVYAIEINPHNETQNFQPVIESVQNPVFTIDNGNIFVLSGEHITVNDI